MREVQEGITYNIISDHPDVKDDWAIVEILEPPYENILIKFGEISFGSVGADEMLECSFNYELIKSAKHTEPELGSDVEFNNLLGDIAINIISNNLDTAFKDKDEDGTDINENRAENFEVPD